MRNSLLRLGASIAGCAIILQLWNTNLLATGSATAPVVVPPELKFNRWSLRAIREGSKTATVRAGVRSFPDGLIKAVGGVGESLILQNVSTASKKVKDLTDADARANGSDSLDELRDDLTRDYPGIRGDDVVTVITFRVSDASK